MFKAFEFCLPTNGNKVPAGPGWFHEIKQDGFRIRVERDRDRVRPDVDNRLGPPNCGCPSVDVDGDADATCTKTLAADAITD
jgi:hypothetical protein